MHAHCINTQRCVVSLWGCPSHSAGDGAEERADWLLHLCSGHQRKCEEKWHLPRLHWKWHCTVLWSWSLQRTLVKERNTSVLFLCMYVNLLTWRCTAYTMVVPTASPSCRGICCMYVQYMYVLYINCNSLSAWWIEEQVQKSRCMHAQCVLECVHSWYVCTHKVHVTRCSSQLVH